MTVPLRMEHCNIRTKHSFLDDVILVLKDPQCELSPEMFSLSSYL